MNRQLGLLLAAMTIGSLVLWAANESNGAPLDDPAPGGAPTKVAAPGAARAPAPGEPAGDTSQDTSPPLEKRLGELDCNGPLIFTMDSVSAVASPDGTPSAPTAEQVLAALRDLRASGEADIVEVVEVVELDGGDGVPGAGVPADAVASADLQFTAIDISGRVTAVGSLTPLPGGGFVIESLAGCSPVTELAPPPESTPVPEPPSEWSTETVPGAGR